MPHPTLPILFFAGTDTDVGKTYVASLVAAMIRRDGKRVGVYKPVASGCRHSKGDLIADDAVHLWEAAGRPRSLAEVCPQRFERPLAPPEAAAAEGKTVDPQQLFDGADCWRNEFDVLIVEGAGGLLSPLANGLLNLDLAKQLGASLVIVAANRLGAIHQTLATCIAAAAREAAPRGVILSDPTGDGGEATQSNASQIKRYCDVPLLATVPFRGSEEDVRGIQKLLI